MLRILHVDDNHEDLELTKYQLTKKGKDLEIDWAESAQEALEVLKSNNYDCILSDYQMPGMNGLQLLSTLRNSGFEIPFIFLTGQGNEDVAAEAFRKGSDDYYTKEAGFAHYQRLLNRIKRVVEAYERRIKHQEAERALRESEKKYRSLVIRANDLIAIIQGGLISYANPKLEELVGYSFEEAIQAPFEKFIYPDEVDRLRENYRRRMAGGRVPELYESALLHKDGRRIDVEINAGVIEFEGKPADLVFIRDITSRKAAEEALRKSEATLKSVFRAAPIGIGLVSMDRILGWTNEGITQMTGYTPEELKGKNARLLYESEEDFLRVGREKHAKIRKHGTGSVETRLRRKDGSLVDILLSSSAIDPNDLSAGLIFTATDITESRRAEQSLAESVREKEVVLSSLLEHVLFHDRNLAIKWANRAAGDSVGLSPEELIGRHCYEVWHQRREPCPGCPVLEAINTGKPRSSEITTPDGRVWCLSGNPVFDSEGEVIGAVETTLEITDRMRANQAIKESRDQLERHTKELEAMNRELEAFNYSVSHDLKSPLLQIGGLAEILLEEYAQTLDTKGLQLLQRILKSARKTLLLIDEIMKLSLLAQSRLEQDSVNLSSLARSICDDLKESAPHRDVSFLIADGLTAGGDPHLIRAALENLLGNAFKFTSKRKDAVIELGLADAEGRRVFFVRDNGVGFDPEQSHKLFLPFQRLHPGSEYSGTGIGLATVQRIVRLHGGRVWAESRPGKGATFYFTLSKG